MKIIITSFSDSRRSKKKVNYFMIDAEAKKDKTAEDFKLTDEDPLHYFFMSFNSHVYD
jgi:hypothetical protein